VDLDRRDIERTDFASVRRGYDPAEVDQHLKAIADAAEQNQESSRDQTAAGAASRGVKKILESAERLAADIEQAAREEAENIEANARSEGEQIVARANEQAAAEEKRANRAGERLKRANSELSRLREALAGLQPVGMEEEVADEPPASDEEAAPAATAHREPTNGDGAVGEAQESLADTAHEAAPEEQAAASPDDADAADGEGARLIALNMALTGTPREETARYLEENFELEDPEAILDDAYSRAG
jgi:DivIVA domain-containing protein